MEDTLAHNISKGLLPRETRERASTWLRKLRYNTAAQRIRFDSRV
jgi:hypothetical protein